MSNDFSQRAAKGQAYNLAVLTAIADGKHHDNKYIVEQFLRHLKFADLLQNNGPDMLATAVKNPKILALLEEVKSELLKSLN